MATNFEVALLKAKVKIMEVDCPRDWIENGTSIDLATTKYDFNDHVKGCREITCRECWLSEAPEPEEAN